uniref:Regulator of microtubule dynamics 1 n=1 Tax=Catharus ustulatus TaxID=91951 RepID=A0A8C3Y1R8_CATUS
MAALMASLARPFHRGPAGLGTALRRQAAPCGRGWPGTQVLRKNLQRGVVLSAGSFLVYEAHKLISGFAEVHASFKVEDVIEQADYLYGSGETEKLYRLLVQHKNRKEGLGIFFLLMEKRMKKELIVVEVMMQSCYGGWHGHHGIWLSLAVLLQRRRNN